MVQSEQQVSDRFLALAGFLNERTRRLVAAAEAKALGYGGVSLVARATGVSRRAIHVGQKELQESAPVGRSTARVRQPGGGRKRTTNKDPSLEADLERLVEGTSRGDPMSPLRWTCKSVRRLAEELRGSGHRVSHQLVAELLVKLGYSLQANVKRHEGEDHPDRNAQSEYLNRQVEGFLAEGQPVISLDTKKKELVGEFKNSGREWRLKGQPCEVRVHDFVIPPRQQNLWVRMVTTHTQHTRLEALKRAKYAHLTEYHISRAGRRAVATAL